MTIAKYLPLWFRRRSPKAARPKASPLSSKGRQVLPALPPHACPPPRLQDDDSPAGYRIYWRA
jgi:hypothetical protein